ncbi:GNAT family N-acetyltransferase [Herbaspirillum sp. RV1423]|uniref:GNAT family N-acetyltransferase n=1 Tax=Herbaspirillum sp. RV1423 TaxID=1443993 RepID=UPI00068445C9|nr:GNAT family N-acetyltransferase [Herbaspirillum sp. RV1423]
MIKTTYLKIEKDKFFAPVRFPEQTKLLTTVPAVNPGACASLYKEVGRKHYWDIYRMAWTSKDWDIYLKDSRIDITFLCNDNRAVGYLELKKHDTNIEIVNFGLKPDCIGKGLGKIALEKALSHGFSFGANEIWLHTCTLDHPAALKVYYARGFEFTKETVDNFIPLDPSPASAMLLT